MASETIPDIIVEMRRREKSHYYPRVARNIMHQYSDRIEAAWKREKAEWEAAACAFVSDAVMSGKVAVEHAPVGNAAAMREALLYMLKFDATEDAAMDDGLTDAERIMEYADHIAECQKKARAAISAPPRNCDVGTAEEQTERQARFCAAHRWCGTNCPAWEEGQAHNGCVLVWGQMPYEAKEAE